MISLLVCRMQYATFIWINIDNMNQYMESAECQRR